jgi:endonuclease/exonuclease/phosphatase family metal-dependent hydrolase
VGRTHGESDIRLVAYNARQGGPRDPAVWARILSALSPDIFFVQESRDPAVSWLAPLSTGPVGAAASGTNEQRVSWLWAAVPNSRGRWGSGLCVREGSLTPLPVPEDFTGRVVAGVVEGREWPGIGVRPVVALSIHGPTRKGSSYIKEVGRILDFAGALAGGLPLILAGDFNVVVGLRQPEHSPSVSRGEMTLLQRLRYELGLIPCWQTAHPGEPLARTLRWMHRIDSPPYHCDGIFMPLSWAAALRDCTVLEGDEWYALSDHNPVVATLAYGLR